MKQDQMDCLSPKVEIILTFNQTANRVKQWP